MRHPHGAARADTGSSTLLGPSLHPAYEPVKSQRKAAFVSRGSDQLTYVTETPSGLCKPAQEQPYLEF